MVRCAGKQEGMRSTILVASYLYLALTYELKYTRSLYCHHIRQALLERCSLPAIMTLATGGARPTPMPTKQIVVLMITRLAEPIRYAWFCSTCRGSHA